MIGTFFFSIAGKKRHSQIDLFLDDLLNLPQTPKNDRLALEYTIKVVNAPNVAEPRYPSKEYYSQYYQDYGIYHRSLSEVGNYVEQIKDFYRRQSIQSAVIDAVNSSDNTKELVQAIEKAVSTSDSAEDDEIEVENTCFSDDLKRPLTEGIKSGIPALDEVTHGFQETQVSSIIAFTSQGKSMMCLSTAFKAALSGRKVCYLSLEMTPKLINNILQARFIYEVKGVDIDYQELLHRTISEEKKKLVLKYEEEFREQIQKNLIVVTASVLTKERIRSEKKMLQMYEKLALKLDGRLDLVIWDHVNQLDLLFKDEGNAIIAKMRYATNEYRNPDGTGVHTMMAVQANRDGYARACRRDGLYDLRAVSELNEVERTSCYAVFLYTPDDMKIAQETKVCMLKHRIGMVMPEPVVTGFYPAVGLVGTNVEQLSFEGEFDSFAVGDDSDF